MDPGYKGSIATVYTNLLAYWSGYDPSPITKSFFFLSIYVHNDYFDSCPDSSHWSDPQKILKHKVKLFPYERECFFYFVCFEATVTTLMSSFAGGTMGYIIRESIVLSIFYQI